MYVCAIKKKKLPETFPGPVIYSLYFLAKLQYIQMYTVHRHDIIRSVFLTH